MVKIEQQDDVVVFVVEGWHKLWALRSELRIPQANIKGARRDAQASHAFGLRIPGTHVPGFLKAGTFYIDGFFGSKPSFIDVRHDANTIVVDLADEQFNRLIIEVEDPDAAVALLTRLATPTS
ncbi:hypothetical protein [Hymenobacter coccineus]|uniref:Bacterial Pleckstrin homology domain-containing protein n=1 Tax=Hymenobacter coccineus TaxID=1908235 RepID=A0A1G1TG59_9BACT|nr:hypothetical protein [Hymenobacter coccineus]OGX89845.1 hypothetical protein BEN49_24350 [Hymenobacter coccineus]